MKRFIIAFLLVIVFIIILNYVKTFFTEDKIDIINSIQEIKLSEKWKFQIGDDSSYSHFEFDDSSWDEIIVPSSWEEQGYHGYNGYAWYRKSFTLNLDSKKNYILNLGYVDDVDETYINGKLLGKSGTFPPNYSTAYNAERKYFIPFSYLREGKNVIAVRIYDAQLSGGIMSGNIGIKTNYHGFILDQPLDGLWKFSIGDSIIWSTEKFDDKHWNEIVVPSFWERQGFDEYNGFGWYRKIFVLDTSLTDKKLVLLLGKIDDIDEVYINGRLIGSTGKLEINENGNIPTNNEYLELRSYFIPDGLLYKNKPNTIAVRVYDGWIDGGIYEGPVGLIRQSEFGKQMKARKTN